MHIMNSMSVKQIAETEEGELVALNDPSGRSEFAMILSVVKSGRQTAVLSPGKIGRSPHLSIADPESLCVSFGKSWLFEVLPIGPEDWIGFGDDMTRPGRVVVEGGEVMFVLAESRNGNQAVGSPLNLATRTITRPDVMRAASFKSWRVWASAEARADPHGQPLFRSVAGTIDDDE